MARRHRALLGAAVAVGVVLSGTGCLFSPPEDIEVTIDDGTLRGVADDGVRSWLAIPYAAPPVNDLRWRPPEPPKAWSDVRAAEEFESECVQPEKGGISDDSSEDCLYLNVFRPDTDEQDLPVMVWFHGGGLASGNGNLNINIVSGLVAHDVVVVSVNYRLGRLGYFAHPALAAENGPEGPIANFGLLDQVASLQWVQDNVEEFGGDADSVTIFGISAGGASVNYLMTSPLAGGLFDRAISGSGLGREQPLTYRAAAAQGEEVTAAATGIPNADGARLRDLDASVIAGWPAYQLLNQLPILDRALPLSPSAAFASGAEASVPYLNGTTDVEFPESFYPVVGIQPEVAMDRFAAGREAEVDAAYGDENERTLHFLDDLIFTEPARYLAEEHAARAPAYRYLFEIAGSDALERFGGANHGSDLPYVFGYGGGKTLDNHDELAEEVSGCWASFARTGVPSCGGVEWPQAADGLMRFTNDGPEVSSVDPWQARLDLVEQLRGAR